MFNLELNIDKSIQIKKVLTYVGFDFALAGTQYLKEILLEVLEDPKLLHSINTTLMKKVSELHNNTIKNIDRDIRWAIIKAYSRGVLNCVPCFSNNKTPTTKQMIVWLFDFIVD